MEKREYSYSIAVLKIWMSFCVVCCHFWGDTTFGANILQLLCDGAVPVFFFMSFYLTNNIFDSNDVVKLKKRLIRLVYPFVMWGIIYWVFFYLVSYVINGPKLNIEDLLWQITLGSVAYLCPQMWFQFDLILITAVCFGICSKFGKGASLILIIISGILICVQYAGINAGVFQNLRYEVRYSLGRLAEMFPVAVCGMYFGKKNILSSMKEKKGFWMCFLILLEVLVYLGGFSKSEGFGYGGTKYIVHAITIFCLTNLLPIDLLSFRIKGVIKSVARYSFGVYCLHMMIGRCFLELLEMANMSINSFVECIIIYVLCIASLFLFGLIPSKYVSQLVE